jgi:hypothetical protein
MTQFNISINNRGNLEQSNKQAGVNKNDGAFEPREAIIAIEVPVVDFEVKYYLLHIKDGEDSWLPPERMNPINTTYYMAEPSGSSNTREAKVTTQGNIGYQFKCFDKCDPQYHERLIRSLERLLGYSHEQSFENDRGSFALVKRGLHDNNIWFILPQYHETITVDTTHPFLNNYYHWHAHNEPGLS